TGPHHAGTPGGVPTRLPGSPRVRLSPPGPAAETDRSPLVGSSRPPPPADRGLMAQQPLPDADPTIGRLVSDASRDLSSLIRNEIKLAKTEVQVSVKAGGTGIAMFAAAVFFIVMALIMLSVAIAYFLNWNGRGLALQWAFLVVFAFYLLLAIVL